MRCNCVVVKGRTFMHYQANQLVAGRRWRASNLAEKSEMFIDRVTTTKKGTGPRITCRISVTLSLRWQLTARHIMHKAKKLMPSKDCMWKWLCRTRVDDDVSRWLGLFLAYRLLNFRILLILIDVLGFSCCRWIGIKCDAHAVNVVISVRKKPDVSLRECLRENEDKKKLSVVDFHSHRHSIPMMLSSNPEI